MHRLYIELAKPAKCTLMSQLRKPQVDVDPLKCQQVVLVAVSPPLFSLQTRSPGFYRKAAVPRFSQPQARGVIVRETHSRRTDTKVELPAPLYYKKTYKFSNWLVTNTSSCRWRRIRRRRKLTISRLESRLSTFPWSSVSYIAYARMLLRRLVNSMAQ